jgi:hypothetical protein
VGPQLVMTMVPNNRGNLYNVVKKLCYVDLPMPSQVGATFQSGLPDGRFVYQKIAKRFILHLFGMDDIGNFLAI